MADPVDAGLQAIFDTGSAVGELARRRFPNGALVEEPYRQHDEAIRTTQSLLADTATCAVYEAAFTFQRIRTRVDVLRRSGQGEFDLVEVKSTTRVKPEHITDVAIQVYVAGGAGVHIRRAYLAHVNSRYVYRGGGHDLNRLFTLEDVSERTRSFVANQVPSHLARMWATLRLDSPPDIETGQHCRKPYPCSFYGHCHYGETQDDRQLYVSPSLASSLREIAFPASFLDFETVNPAIPMYIGTRPYQPIPFQWSLHVRDSSGRSRHDSFLNADAEDPRERFVSSLLRAIPSRGSIVTYSPYERTILNRLAQGFPKYRDRLLALCDRIVDLLRLIRENYYHPDFGGSYSLKSVAPALIPSLDYTDLEIPEGMAAAASYARMTASDTPESEKARISYALLAYCQRDTEAMLQIYDALLAEADGD